MSDTSPGLIQKKDGIRWDLLSVLIGISSLIFSFIPYLSMGGSIMGLAAILLGLKAVSNKQKKFWAILGILTGSLSILALLLVLILLIFF